MVQIAVVAAIVREHEVDDISKQFLGEGDEEAGEKEGAHTEQ